MPAPGTSARVLVIIIYPKRSRVCAATSLEVCSHCIYTINVLVQTPSQLSASSLLNSFSPVVRGDLAVWDHSLELRQATLQSVPTPQWGTAHAEIEGPPGLSGLSGQKDPGTRTHTLVTAICSHS